jgi:Asp-tRNA(Asn)/Glu-tRNA(Gln) amidotransferase A subunit family amidase
MPFGLQVMSKNFNELALLQVAEYLMRVNKEGENNCSDQET